MIQRFAVIADNAVGMHSVFTERTRHQNAGLDPGPTPYSPRFSCGTQTARREVEVSGLPLNQFRAPEKRFDESTVIVPGDERVAFQPSRRSSALEPGMGCAALQRPVFHRLCDDVSHFRQTRRSPFCECTWSARTNFLRQPFLHGSPAERIAARNL